MITPEQMEPARPAVEGLRAMAAFLRLYMEHFTVHVQGVDRAPGGHHPSGFAAVQIPDWAVKQRLADIDATLALSGYEQLAAEIQNAPKTWKPALFIHAAESCSKVFKNKEAFLKVAAAAWDRKEGQ